MIEHKFTDLEFTQFMEDKAFMLKLTQLSYAHNVITISINDFVRILKDTPTLNAVAMTEAITSLAVLKTGLYYRINKMDVYVSKEVQSGYYKIGRV